VLGEGGRCSSASRPRARGHALGAPVSLPELRGVWPKGHTVLTGRLVNAHDGKACAHGYRLREDRLPLGRAWAQRREPPCAWKKTGNKKKPTTNASADAGRVARRLTRTSSDDLRAPGALLPSRRYDSTPLPLWRCGTPLLYYAKPPGYNIRNHRSCAKPLLAATDRNWQPPRHIKHGGFVAIGWRTRSRRRGPSLGSDTGVRWPCGLLRRATSTSSGPTRKLRERSGVDHRDPQPSLLGRTSPSPDSTASRKCAVYPRSSTCGFVLGSMPFAQYHAPFERPDEFEGAFPADFNLRGLDQLALVPTRSSPSRPAF